MSKIFVENENEKRELKKCVAISMQRIKDELDVKVTFTEDIKGEDDDFRDNFAMTMLGLIDKISDLDMCYYIYKQKFGGE